MALRPLPGSRPAWAATPWTVSSNSPQPLRLVFAAPPGQRRFEDEHRAALAAPPPRSRRATSRCRSLRRVVQSIVIVRTLGQAQLAQRAHREHRDADARPSCRRCRDRAAARRLRGAACARADRPARPCRSARGAGPGGSPAPKLRADVIAALPPARRVTRAPSAGQAGARAPRRSDRPPPCRVLGDSRPDQRLDGCRAASRSLRLAPERRVMIVHGDCALASRWDLMKYAACAHVAGDSAAQRSALRRSRAHGARSRSRFPQPATAARQPQPAEAAARRHRRPPTPPARQAPRRPAAPTEATLGMPILPGARSSSRRTTPAAASATTCSAPTLRSRRSSSTTGPHSKQRGELVYDEPPSTCSRSAGSARRRWRFRRA